VSQAAPIKVRRLPLLLSLPDLVTWAPAVLARLVDQRSGRELGRIELRGGEPIQPAFPITSQAMETGALAIPDLDLNAVRSALSEDERGPLRSVDRLGEEKTNMRECRLEADVCSQELRLLWLFRSQDFERARVAELGSETRRAVRNQHGHRIP
jgi:hypothetical protein